MSRWRHFKEFAGGPLAMIGGCTTLVGLFLPLAGVDNVHLAYITCIIGLVLAYWGTYRNNVALGKRLTPLLRFSAGPDVHGSSDYSKAIAPRPIEFNGQRVMYSQPARRWFRVVVETKEDAPVKDCIAEITGITRDGQSVFPPNKVRITWQPGEPDQKPRTIHPGTPEYLDVLAISDSGGITIATPGLVWGYESTDKIFEHEGDYMIAIAVKTDGMTNHIILRFEWRKDWKKSQLICV